MDQPKHSYCLPKSSDLGLMFSGKKGSILETIKGEKGNPSYRPYTLRKICFGAGSVYVSFVSFQSKGKPPTQRVS